MAMAQACCPGESHPPPPRLCSGREPGGLPGRGWEGRKGGKRKGPTGRREGEEGEGQERWEEEEEEEGQEEGLRTSQARGPTPRLPRRQGPRLPGPDFRLECGRGREVSQRALAYGSPECEPQHLSPSASPQKEKPGRLRLGDKAAHPPPKTPAGTQPGG